MIDQQLNTPKEALCTGEHATTNKSQKGLMDLEISNDEVDMIEFVQDIENKLDNELKEIEQINKTNHKYNMNMENNIRNENGKRYNPRCSMRRQPETTPRTSLDVRR